MRFTPVCKARYATLLPCRDGIEQLREKGASYDAIREVLAAAGVTVAVDTIDNFVREVIEQRERPQANPRRRPKPQLFTAHSAPAVGTTKLLFTVAPPWSPPLKADAEATRETAIWAGRSAIATVSPSGRCRSFRRRRVPEIALPR